MILKLLFLFTLTIYGQNSFANKGIYLDVGLGSVVHINSGEFDFSLFEPELTYKSSSNQAVAVGYGLEVFHMELIYSYVGDTGFNYDEYLDYTRNTSYFGFNARWKWRWFSTSIGLGQVIIDADAEELTDSTQTISYEVDEGRNNYLAARLSVGANFPINEKLNLYIENIFLHWAQDDGELTWSDSDSFFNNGGDEDAKDSQTLAMLNLGLRYYFK